MVNHEKTLLLLFDGLGAKYLDPYGQSDFRHPAFNRLAAESILFENLIANSVDTETVTKSIFGCGKPGETNSIFDSLRNAGLRSELIIDSSNLRNSYPVRYIDQMTIVQQDATSSIADSFENTELARTFAQVIDLVNASNAQFICVHVSSLARVWDAPLINRVLGLGDEDPDLEEFYLAPRQNIHWRDDPDQYLQWMTAYHAQVRVLDQCVGLLLDEFVSNWPNSMILLTATGGYSLGEHGIVGPEATVPFIEATHIPFLVKLPQSTFNATRVWKLHGTDLVNNVLQSQLCDDDIQTRLGSYINERDNSKAILISEGKNDSMSIRTNSWSYVYGGNQRSLFVRPDDIWEVNNVFDRCATVAEAMCELKDQIASKNIPVSLPSVIFEPAN